MTTHRKSSVTDDRQLNLLDMLSQQQLEEAAKRPGRLCVASRLLAAGKNALKNACKSREAVADEMSNLTGMDITVNMLNSWFSDAHPHRLPAEFLPAFCEATGTTEPIRMLGESINLFTLDGPGALRSQLQKKVEERQVIEREIRKTKTLIHVLEGNILYAAIDCVNEFSLLKV